MEHIDRNSVNIESFTDFNKIISTNKIQMLHENTFQLHKRQTNLIFHNNITFSGEGGFTFTVSASSTLKGSSMCFGSLGVALLENAFPVSSKTGDELSEPQHTGELAMSQKGK